MIIAAGSDGETDTFDVTPDAANPLIFKYTSLKGKTDLRFTGLASYFGNRALVDQKVLKIAWRVSWNNDDQELSIQVSMAPAQGGTNQVSMAPAQVAQIYPSMFPSEHKKLLYPEALSTLGRSSRQRSLCMS